MGKPNRGKHHGKTAKADSITPENEVHNSAERLAATADSYRDQPLPRAQKRRRRAAVDRGLPPDEELARLAKEYVSVQSIAWPELVRRGVLLGPDSADIAGMVEDLKQRHRTGVVVADLLRPISKLCPKLGGAYSRYSCDNSSPTSIIDQMVNALKKARSEDRFVPWSYVFCDYSVSGLNSSRQGYSSYKRVLEEQGPLIETTYIDDFTRASRDELEWWKLASLSKRLGKRMIGASDGFDLSAADWDIKITIYGLVSRLFIKSLREKVRRGMSGAARRRTSLGKPPLGFTRCVCRDEKGNVICGSDGLSMYKLCIDPETEPHLQLLFELFTEKRWSIHRIAKHFNQMRVDGWDGWTNGGIKRILWNPASIGVFIWNRTRQEYDWEKEKTVIVENPRDKWIVHYDRSMAIVSMESYRAARRRLTEIRRACPITGRKRSRNQRSATTLFSGTLFCADCDRELRLYRSTSKYKVLSCHNGRSGIHGCKLSTSKSVRIIENCLLGFLRNHLLTPNTIEKLVSKANDFLLKEADRPRAPTASLKRRIRQLEATINRLFQRIENQSDEHLCQAYDRQIAAKQKELTQLKAELRSIETNNEPPPPPLKLENVTSLIAELPAILNQEIPAAAEALRALTGPISIRQERVPGKPRGAAWIAKFTPDLIAWLCQRAKQSNCPDSVTLEHLKRRNWITPETVEVRLDHVYKHEMLAGQITEMARGGASHKTIASVLKTEVGTIRSAIKFAAEGGVATNHAAYLPPTKTARVPKYEQIAPEVVRLFEHDRWSFAKIAGHLHVGYATVTRAYDFLRPEAVELASQWGGPPGRQWFRRSA